MCGMDKILGSINMRLFGSVKYAMYVIYMRIGLYLSSNEP